MHRLLVIIPGSHLVRKNERHASSVSNQVKQGQVRQVKVITITDKLIPGTHVTFAAGTWWVVVIRREYFNKHELHQSSMRTLSPETAVPPPLYGQAWYSEQRWELVSGTLESTAVAPNDTRRSDHVHNSINVIPGTPYACHKKLRHRHQHAEPTIACMEQVARGDCKQVAS